MERHGSQFATWRTRYDAFIDSDDEDFDIIQNPRFTIPYGKDWSYYRYCDWNDEGNFRTIPEEDFGTAPEEEGSLFRFYGLLVENIVSRHRLDNSLIGRELGEMIDCYKSTNQGRNPKILDFDQLTLCVGYLHRYAYCHSVLVRRALVKMLDAMPTPLRGKLNRAKLRAVFLGSGPANDLVGFLSALYGHHGTIGEINATCVDRHIGWGWVLHESVRNLRQSSFGNCSQLLEDVNVTAEYVSADLTDVSTWRRDNVREHLRKADIVFLVKFLSHVPDEKKLITLQNVAQSMHSGALLVYIDCPFNSSLFEDTSLNLCFVYGQDKKAYILKNSRHQFGFSSIDRSTAFVKLYEKH